MGSSCCHAESPCSSAEERSGLLNDSKATVPTGETVVGGNCGPDGDDDKRITPDEANIKVDVKAEAVLVKQSPEVGETEPNNTQDNGNLQEAVTSSPRKGSELRENSSRAQDGDIKDRPVGSRQAEVLQCTFNFLQKENAAADWEDFTEAKMKPEEENPATVKNKLPDMSSQAEAVCPENHLETNTTTEHAAAVAARDNSEETSSKVTLDAGEAEPSGELSQSNEVLSVPNSQLTAAACQLSFTSVVTQEINKEPPSRAVTEDVENGSSSAFKDEDPGVIKSQDVSESSHGSELTGPDLSGEERETADCAGEREVTALADAGESSKSDQDAKPNVEHTTESLKEATSPEKIKQDIGEEMMLKGQDEDGDVPAVEKNDEVEEEAANTSTENETQVGEDAEIQDVTGEEEQLAGSSSTAAQAEETTATEKEASAEDGMENSEEDLYRGAEELSTSQENKPGPQATLETTLLKAEDRCSLAPAMDILSYSEREWKGNTAKSALIRKGYKEMSQKFGSLRRVRGDNYCALRATLFQALSHSTQLPAWLQDDDITMLPEQLEAQEGLISRWTFPGECLQGDGTGDATLQLKGYMELLKNKWQTAVDCSSAVERQELCERVFQGGEEELGLLEALKLLMLGRAVELHSCMQAGADVPLFCWLLFARDSSDCPRSFLSNHLSHVGLSAGLEQVEMFLLGYALQCTIQVYRLYKADTEEFVTYYPDDHKDEWPSVCLVTEDDRHYNVPVVEAAEHTELNSS